MLPNPHGNRYAVTITQCVNYRSNTRQVMATTGEAMPPTMPLRWFLYHRDTMRVVCVRPLLAQLAEFNDTTAFVVIGHPTRNLIGGDIWNKHGGQRLR